MDFLEDYVLTNMKVFADAGVPSVMLQDQTREIGPASPATIAIMGALGRLATREFPQVNLGIIVRAHDAQAPLAIADAVAASFVRLKVFVGAVMSIEGPKNGLAVAARTYPHKLRRDDIAILTDIFDRTSVPTIAVTPEEAAMAAEKLGADGLITRQFCRYARPRAPGETTGVRRPILIGGSVSENTMSEAFEAADSAIYGAHARTARARTRPMGR